MGLLLNLKKMLRRGILSGTLHERKTWMGYRGERMSADVQVNDMTISHKIVALSHQLQIIPYNYQRIVQ